MFHQKYGDAVRLAPNEISFIDPRAWNDIIARRPDRKYFPKNPVWWDTISGIPDSIVNVGETEHARLRRLLARGFSDKALREQEPTVRQYVDTFIQKLQNTVKSRPSESNVSIVDWYRYLAFDITGDLGFGQSFDCLQEGKYHEWIQILFKYLKANAFIAAIRFYPSVWQFLLMCIPKSLLDIQKEHCQFVVDRVQRRLEVKPDKKDLVTHMLAEDEGQRMTNSEIAANLNIIIIAGADTTAAALVGITNYLVKYPLVYDKLVMEIRTTFKAEQEMTFLNLQKALYLNAVIDEGMRMAPPIATGAPRLVPEGGEYVCGHWLPGGVSCISHTRYDFRSLASRRKSLTWPADQCCCSSMVCFSISTKLLTPQRVHTRTMAQFRSVGSIRYGPKSCLSALQLRSNTMHRQEFGLRNHARDSCPPLMELRCQSSRRSGVDL